MDYHSRLPILTAGHGLQICLNSGPLGFVVSPRNFGALNVSTVGLGSSFTTSGAFSKLLHLQTLYTKRVYIPEPKVTATASSFSDGKQKLRSEPSSTSNGKLPVFTRRKVIIALGSRDCFFRFGSSSPGKCSIRRGCQGSTGLNPAYVRLKYHI